MGASAALLNGTGPVRRRTAQVRRESKKTIDQYIADTVAGDTPLRSLEVGTEDMGTSAGACDGYPCVFFNTISWRDDTSPLPVAINPRVTFERMFGETGIARSGALRGCKEKQSLLDSVTRGNGETAAHARRGRQRASSTSTSTNIRDVEQQLERMETPARHDRRAGRTRRSACPKPSTIT